MAESKRSPGRLSTFRDSVKKLTERLSDSDGEASPVRKPDEQNREVEKLRTQIQSLEDELRRLQQLLEDRLEA